MLDREIASSRRNHKPAVATTNRFVFMCGTPRSGTSFLAGIFGQHPLLAMGIERFKSHYAKKTLSPDLFGKERFFDLRAEDTSLPERLALPRVAMMREKYDRCVLVGDKYPTIVRHFGWINERFSGPTFLVVLRHPVHVARSWAVRAANKKDHWPETNDFPAGIRYWTDTLMHVVNARRAGMKIVCVDYDLLMAAPEDTVMAYVAGILERIGLPYSEEMCLALLETRRPGRDTFISDTEAAIMPGILASDAWKAFVRNFGEVEGGLPRWAQPDWVSDVRPARRCIVEDGSGL